MSGYKYNIQYQYRPGSLLGREVMGWDNASDYHKSMGLRAICTGKIGRIEQYNKDTDEYTVNYKGCGIKEVYKSYELLNHLITTSFDFSKCFSKLNFNPDVLITNKELFMKNLTWTSKSDEHRLIMEVSLHEEEDELNFFTQDEEGCTSILMDVEDAKSLVQYLNLYIKYKEE